MLISAIKNCSAFFFLGNKYKWYRPEKHFWNSVSHISEINYVIRFQYGLYDIRNLILFCVIDINFNISRKIFRKRLLHAFFEMVDNIYFSGWISNVELFTYLGTSSNRFDVWLVQCITVLIWKSVFWVPISFRFVIFAYMPVRNLLIRRFPAEFAGNFKDRMIRSILSLNNSYNLYCQT